VHVTSVLKLDPTESADARELEFELAYQRSLTTAQRFEMMLHKSRQMAEQLARLGHRKPAEVVKRT